MSTWDEIKEACAARVTPLDDLPAALRIAVKESPWSYDSAAIAEIYRRLRQRMSEEAAIAQAIELIHRDNDAFGERMLRKGIIQERYRPKTRDE